MKLLVLLFAAMALSAPAGMFDADGPLERSGWTLYRNHPEDEMSAKDGVLTMRCSYNPYKGILYERTVELPEKGMLEVEVCIKAVGGHSDGMCVILSLGDLLLSFKDDTAYRYFPEPQPNWKVIGEHRVPASRWVPLRVIWDNAAKRIRYFVGDMRIPTAVEDGTVAPEGGDDCRLRVGNYGMDRTPMVHRLRNLKLTAGLPAEEAGARELALVFRGLGFSRWPIAGWTKDFAADQIVKFDLVFRGSQALPCNQIALDGYPDESLIRRARLIILADMPLTEDVLTHEMQDNLLAAVRAGARMVVTGGLSGLEHCGDLKAPIIRALPVRLKDPWHPAKPSGKTVANYGKGAICVVTDLGSGRLKSK